MSSFNASSIGSNQQWRNDLLMKPGEPSQKSINEIFKEPPQLKYPGHPGHPGHPVRPGHPGHPVHPGHPGQQGHQGGRPGHATHPGPSGHLPQQGRPSHAGHSGHGHACHPGPSHAGQAGQRGRQMVRNASVCCEQPNCKRAKIEQMPELYFQEPATPFKLVPVQGRDPPQPGNKEPSGPPSDHNYAYCPCGRGGQLVTICCTGRNCDNSTKIDEGFHMGPPQVQMSHPEVHRCPPDVRMGSPDDRTFKGPKEKRARTSYNQYKY